LAAGWPQAQTTRFSIDPYFFLGPLFKHDSCVVDFDFSDGRDHLMILVANIHAQASEFFDKLLDLFFDRIAPHITEVLIGLATKNFEDGTRESVGDGDLGFIGRTKARL
jgi:hypothetical protein